MKGYSGSVICSMGQESMYQKRSAKCPKWSPGYPAINELRGETQFRVHLRVPVLFGDPIETSKHDGQDDTGVLLYQTHDVLIVPVIQGSLSHLPWRRKGRPFLKLQ